jgi:hypothetical protein
MTQAGYCECGCGGKTRIAPCNDRANGYRKGEPLRFIHGHNPTKGIRYEIRDLGYLTPCWIWQLSARGRYGRLTRNGVAVGAHRWMYETHIGPVPDGLMLDHLCRQPLCVNPDHLEPVTNAENQRRAPTVKLDAESAAIIRATPRTAGSGRALARRFGVSEALISEVRSGRRWKT